MNKKMFDLDKFKAYIGTVGCSLMVAGTISAFFTITPLYLSLIVVTIGLIGIIFGVLK